MSFKQGDTVYIREVHQARSIPVSRCISLPPVNPPADIAATQSYVWANSVHDTEYIISKSWQRRKEVLMFTPDTTFLYVPNTSLSSTVNGAMLTQRMFNGHRVCYIYHINVSVFTSMWQAFLTADFEHISRSDKIKISKGTPVTITDGPCTKKVWIACCCPSK